MADGPEHAAVVLSILRLGATLHLETVAEGIELEGQMTALMGLGADLGQGFFFSKALTSAAITAILEEITSQTGVLARESDDTQPEAVRVA